MNRFLLLFASTIVACGADDDSSDTIDTQAPDDTSMTLPRDVDPDGDVTARKPAPKFTFHELTLPGGREGATELRFLPNGNQFLLLEKNGRLSVYSMDGDTVTLKGDAQIPNVFAESDCGLVAAALDKDYTTNHYVYLGHCTSKFDNRVVRVTLDTNDLSTLPGSAVQIINVGDDRATDPWHNVGSMVMDKDGILWILFGEKTVEAGARDPHRLTGKLLRIIPQPSGGYVPAPDNLFDDEADGRTEIRAMGLRSPWKGTLDSHGRFWVGDVGAAVTEEINAWIPGGPSDFGWPTWEGPCLHDCDGLIQPLQSWDRSGDNELSLADDQTPPTTRRVAWVGLEYRPGRGGGADRYSGELDERVIYGDFCAGWVRTMELDATNTKTLDELSGHLESVTGVDQGNDGFVYAVTYGNCSTFPLAPARLWRSSRSLSKSRSVQNDCALRTRL